jgi:hypothetical protein
MDSNGADCSCPALVRLGHHPTSPGGSSESWVLFGGRQWRLTGTQLLTWTLHFSYREEVKGRGKWLGSH